MRTTPRAVERDTWADAALFREAMRLVGREVVVVNGYGDSQRLWLREFAIEASGRRTLTFVDLFAPFRSRANEQTVDIVYIASIEPV